MYDGNYMFSHNSFNITDNVISVFAAVGGALSFVKPKRRAFSLLDLNISFPFGEFPGHNVKSWES